MTITKIVLAIILIFAVLAFIGIIIYCLYISHQNSFSRKICKCSKCTSKRLCNRNGNDNGNGNGNGMGTEMEMETKPLIIKT